MNSNLALSPGVGPLQIELRFKLKLSTDEAFKLVAFEIPQWFTQVHEVRWDHSRSENGAFAIGACSARVCTIGNKALAEEIVKFVPGESYSYRVDMVKSTMKMPIKNHLGEFEVKALAGGSIIIWKQYFDAPFWPLGALVRLYMRDFMMKPAVKNLLEEHQGELC